MEERQDTPDLARVKTHWYRWLEQARDQVDNDMEGLSEVFARRLARFQQEKATILEALSRVEGEKSARKMYEESLDAMMPTSLRRLLVLSYIDRVPALENEEAMQEMPRLCSPLKTQNPMDVHQRSELTTSVSHTTFIESTPFLTHKIPASSLLKRGASHNHCSKQDISKRQSHGKDLSSYFLGLGNTKRSTQSARELTQGRIAPVRPEKTSSSAPGIQCELSFFTQQATQQAIIRPAQPLMTPKCPPIHAWEVVGKDYTFNYAPFGPGWFVLRCARGTDLEAITFEIHPLTLADTGQEPLGLKHFNGASCRYHTHKTYTEEDMMVAFAQRVVDEEGEDVGETWVLESNEHLAETIAKRALRAGRHRSKTSKNKSESDTKSEE